MNSNLVIVGSHPRSELKRFFMGSASQRILEQAPCSVLTVRKSEVEREPSPARIMVALDGSAHSELTVTWLGARNWANGTEFQFVSILPPLSNEVASGSVADAMSELASHGDLESQIMSEIDNLIYSFAPNLRNYEYAISPEAANGAAANQLVELAEEWRADLLVLGSHGHSGLGKVLIGSISLAVASHAGCSVLIVKERAVEHEPTENKRSDTNLESPHSVPYMF
jgi:nucleotide-binding universal stress UspA family protein